MSTKRDGERQLLCFRTNQGRVLSGQSLEREGVKAVYGAFATSMDVVKKTEMEVSINNYAEIEIRGTEQGHLLMGWSNEYIIEQKSSMLIYVLSEKMEWLIYKAPRLGHGFNLSSHPKKHPSTGMVITRLDSLQHFRAYIEILDLLRENAFRDGQIVYGFRFEGTDVADFS